MCRLVPLSKKIGAQEEEDEEEKEDFIIVHLTCGFHTQFM